MIWFLVSRRRVLGASALAALFIAATIILLSLDDGAEIATVLALPVALVSVALGVLAVLPHATLEQAARGVAQQVLKNEGLTMSQLLGDSGDPTPADLGYRAPDDQTEPQLIGWRADGGAMQGTTAQISSYYCRLNRGRLVILGEAGAGKTVAATQLVVDLARDVVDARRSSQAIGQRFLVPVLLSLPTWTPKKSRDDSATSPADLVNELDSWIAQQLQRVYKVPRRQADQLVAEGWVLPVLDGLDEMDPHSASVPQKAAAVVRALNAHGSRRVVLVCRLQHYKSLVANSEEIAGQYPVLQDAQQIILEPLTTGQIREYLANRFPGPEPSTVQPRWQPIVDAITNDGAHSSTLAALLSRPWWLFLAVNVYYSSETDPSELLSLRPAQRVDYLMNRLIPAVVENHPRLGERKGYYDPKKVDLWLRTLALHLHVTSIRYNWSSIDIRWDRIWPLAGGKAQRLFSSIVVASPLSLLVCLLLILGASESRWMSIDQLLILLIASFVVVPIIATVFLPEDLMPGTGALSRNVAVWSVIGTVLVLASWPVPGLTKGIGLGFGYGLAIATSVSRYGGYVDNVHAGLHPVNMNIHISGLFFEIWILLGGWILVAAWLGPSVWLSIIALLLLLRILILHVLVWRDLQRAATACVMILAGAGLGIVLDAWLGLEILVGTWASFLIGLVLVMFFDFQLAWLRYLISIVVLGVRGILPRRLTPFLHWGYRAGLLRRSGTSTQFRHRRLLVWLCEECRRRSGAEQTRG